MSASLLTLATAAALSLAPVAPGAVSFEGPAALAEGFLEAWNKHDGPLFGRLFADDADWVTVGGKRLNGRAEIQTFLEREHATWAKATTMVGVSTDVRAVRADVAVLHLGWEISGSTERDGTPAGPYRGVTLLIAIKDPARGWTIVAGQVNREARSPERSSMPPKH